MTDPSYYRKRADHFRRLAEMTWQDELEALLLRVARDYEEVAEDLEVGAAEVRHADPFRE